MTTAVLPMTRAEADDFRRLDRLVSDRLAGALDVWRALAEIRDRRLYREEFGTFEDYCRKRHDLTPQRVGQLLGHAALVDQLETNGFDPPKNERQSRELGKLADAAQAGPVLDAARETNGSRATAADIADIVALVNAGTPLDEIVRRHESKVHEQAAAIERAEQKTDLERLKDDLEKARRRCARIGPRADAVLAAVADALTRLAAV